MLHSIESQNSVKRSISLDILPPGSSTHAAIIDERRILEHDSASAAEVEARIAKKVALLDQPVREFTTKPGNPQVYIFTSLRPSYLLFHIYLRLVCLSFFKCKLYEIYGNITVLIFNFSY